MAYERSIAVTVSSIARTMRTRFDARARSIGLTRAQWRVIVTIRLLEGATQSEVAAQLEIASVTAGRIIDRLEFAGLVERRADPVDRRANRLHLTQTAAPVLEALGHLGAEEESTILRGFSREEEETLARLLVRVAANLADTTPCPTKAIPDVLPTAKD